MAQQMTPNTSESPAGAACGADREIDLVDYLLTIWRHRAMIVVLMVVAMGATVAYMFVQPRRYRASATIVPPVEVLQKEAASGALGSLGNSMLRNIMDTGSIAGIYVEILKSREVADAIIEDFDLMHVYEDVEHLTQARRELMANTSIETTDEGVVKIAVSDLDPNRAAAVANAYISQLDHQNKRLSGGEATSKRVFLEGRLDEIEAKLSRIDSIPAREAQVQEMLYELLVRECELAKIEEAKSMPTLQVLDEAAVPELPVARGTVNKGVLAGIAAFLFGVFLAFSREYVSAAKGRNRASGGSKPRSDRSLAVAAAGESPKPGTPVVEVGRVPSRRDEAGSDAVERTQPV
jgi:uncharacterized protein involved in exopolysaccharide biosynthesis